MFLMIDNYDSFVYNLVRYFEELDEEIVVHRNDKISIEDIEEMKLEGIIISPGPKSPKEAGISIEIIDKFKGKLPILGICLGHQTIGHYFDGNIVKGEYPIHGKVSLINHNGEGIFKNIKNPLRVTRYHSLIIEDTILDNLDIISYSEDNVIMAVEHKEYPIYGLQFHPEAEMTEDGHKILKNFINLAREFNSKG